MNRIYQGRVSALTFLSPDSLSKTSFNAHELQEQSTSPLWEHHTTFQSAINYYLVALAAMCGPAPDRDEDRIETRLVRDLRARIDASWSRFPRPGDGQSLRDSLSDWLELTPEASLNDSFSSILQGNESSPAAKSLALELLLSKCSGDSAIQQTGRGYFPRFCDSDWSGTPDFSKTAQAAEEGKQKLAKVLHAEPSSRDLTRLSEEFEISWCVKISPGKFFDDDDAIKRLNDAIDNLIERTKQEKPSANLKVLLENHPKAQEQLLDLKDTISSLDEMAPIPRNKKAAPDLTFAAIAFKQFPSSLTADFLRLSVAKPKAKKKAKNSEEQPNFTALKDDPIMLARSDRGFIFPAFTALPHWGGKSDGSPLWKEFDIAAFKEALKSLNQFKQKTDERADVRRDLEGRIAIMLGGSLAGWKPTTDETGEETSAPNPLPENLLEIARKLESELTARMGDTQVGDEQLATFGDQTFAYRPGEWQLSGASVRGLRQIAENWNKLYTKKGRELMTSDLEKVVHDFQRSEKNKKSIGSVPLFLALTEEAYWPLWLDDNSPCQDDEDARNSRNPILFDMVRLHGAMRDFHRAADPINLTPAEPRHSRRLYMFSDVKDKVAKVKFTRHGEKISTLECAIAYQHDGKVSPQRIALDYSAPRLRRDGLSSEDASRWLQPMTKALGITHPDPEGGFDSAVSLMPDFMQPKHGNDVSGLRFLLNFPKKLDSEWIRQALGKNAIWQGQFNGVKDKNLHLHWPSTATTKAAKENPWCQNETVLENGFTILSTDLGQRTAGAWALLRITPWKPETNRPTHSIGQDGEREWCAEVLRTGMFRLPGEDQKVRGKDKKLHRESSGSAGRNSSPAEWNDAKKLAKKLLAHEPENWVGRTFDEKSYPMQNDALIALVNRRLSRLGTYHRWSCFDPERSEVSGRKEKMLKALNDELEHWKDDQVQSWKELVSTEEYEKFREEGGNAFARYRLELKDHLVALANRAAPLRNRSWEWIFRDHGNPDNPYGDLCDSDLSVKSPPKIRGQRGLSMFRLEQLERLRTLFLRYNRSWDRQAGEPAKFGRDDQGRESGEPCEALLGKIDRMKEQRVNQTAHLILAQALGVRLSEHAIDPIERRKNDIHGEYKKIPGRQPVDFIVIENLDRYLTSQGRAPSENSRLMKWSHRAVRDKLKMLAEEPFGIPVTEAPAAYSSRFCAKTSEPGARCEERNSLDNFLRENLSKRGNGKPTPGQPHPDDWKALLTQFEELEKHNQARAPKKPQTLLLPKPGGPLFLGLSASNPVQADTNAAINVGLRAIAAPTALHLIHKIRTQRKKEAIKTIKKNAREKVAFANEPEVKLQDKPSPKLAAASAPNFFYDGAQLSQFDQGKIHLESNAIPVASGVGLWATVNTTMISRIVGLNDQRLKTWGIQSAAIISTSVNSTHAEDADEIPM